MLGKLLTRLMERRDQQANILFLVIRGNDNDDFHYLDRRSRSASTINFTRSWKPVFGSQPNSFLAFE